MSNVCKCDGVESNETPPILPNIVQYKDANFNFEKPFHYWKHFSGSKLFKGYFQERFRIP